MKKKHPLLYSILRRGIIVLLLVLMGLTIYVQSRETPENDLSSPEDLFSKIITPVQNMVSSVEQSISNYLYRIKLRSNIEYEYNQLKAQNDELVLRSILYEE